MTSGNRFFPGKLNCRESEKRDSLHLIHQDDDILRSDKKKKIKSYYHFIGGNSCYATVFRLKAYEQSKDFTCPVSNYKISYCFIQLFLFLLERRLKILARGSSHRPKTYELV